MLFGAESQVEHIQRLESEVEALMWISKEDLKKALKERPKDFLNSMNKDYILDL